jgi:hypothetical protein
MFDVKRIDWLPFGGSPEFSQLKQQKWKGGSEVKVLREKILLPKTWQIN